MPKVTQLAIWGMGLASPQGERSSSDGVIPGHPVLIIWKGKGLEKWECVVAGGAGGTEWGPGVWAVCMGLGRRSLESRHPAFPGSAVHPTAPFCRGLLLPSTTPPPPLQPLGHTVALNKTLRVGVAMCRGRGRYAGHWWPLACRSWLGLEGCWAPRSGSRPQSRGLGLLPTPILSLCVICPSVPGGALEGLCWVGCTEGASV